MIKYSGFKNRKLKRIVFNFYIWLMLISVTNAEVNSSGNTKILDPITITDTNEINELKEGPISVSIIDGKELIGRAVSLTEVLDRVAGVKVRDAGGAGSEQRIAIRGLEGKRVRIFIDGAPINALDGIFGLNDLPVQIIERVEVYKGVIPAKFGSDALGGAVNIVTYSRTYSYADLTYTPSAFNTHRGMLLSKYCLPNGFYVGLGGIINYSDNDYKMNLNTILDRNDPLLTEVVRDHDKYRSNLIGLILGYYDAWFDEICTELVYYGTEKEIQGIEYPIGNAENKSHMFVIAPELEKEDFLFDGLDMDFNLGFVATLGMLVDTSSEFYSDWNVEPSIAVGRSETDAYSKHNTKDTLYGLQARLNLEYEANSVNSFDINNVFQYKNKKPFDSVSKDEAHCYLLKYPAEVFNNTFCLGYNLSLFGKKVQNYLSARLFYQHVNVDTAGNNGLDNAMGKISEDETENINWGIGNAVSIKLVKPLSLHVSYLRSIRLPDESELFGDGVGIQQSLLLEPEKSHAVDVGLHWLSRSRKEILSRLECEISGFYNYTKDLVKLETGLLAQVYKNIDVVRTLGFEADLKADILPWLYLTGNVSIQDIKYVESKIEPFKEGKRLANIPWLFTNTGIELSRNNLFLKNTVAKLYWQGDYTHEFHSAVKVVKKPKDLIESSFEQLLGLQYSIDNKLDICFEIHNLTDKELYDMYKQPLPGRSWHVNLHCFMKKKK